ncbi:hypothetical protein HID58_048352, partial [Brassica napus]
TMVPLPFPSLEIYIYQLVESMIDPQKSIALDSASVMASDRKTEKEVSADSATSLLSEEVSPFLDWLWLRKKSSCSNFGKMRRKLNICFFPFSWLVKERDFLN